MKLKGSKTEKNLIEALKGESLASNKYVYFAKKARKEGFQQIANIFKETSENEKIHAKIWFEKLGKLGDTKENLLDAINGEFKEHTMMYPKFAEIAKKEGFDEISSLFDMVSRIEEEHKNRFEKLLNNIKNNKVFKNETTKEWICLVCGHIIKNKKVNINICPVCKHSMAFREIKKNNF